MINPWHI